MLAFLAMPIPAVAPPVVSTTASHAEQSELVTALETLPMTSTSTFDPMFETFPSDSGETMATFENMIVQSPIERTTTCIGNHENKHTPIRRPDASAARSGVADGVLLHGLLHHLGQEA